jgi:hypothetical protein
MKITTNFKNRVEAPSDCIKSGIIAFQVVEFTIDYLGAKIVSSHDTKIMEDGSQFVIEGDGFIPSGYQVA